MELQTFFAGCDKPEHVGHKICVGGPADGKVSHLVKGAGPSDYPLFWTSCKSNGRRARYARDLNDGADCRYYFVGWDYS